MPIDGFGSIADFARIAGHLYEVRNLADYDPSRDFTPDEAKVAISDAREAITWFQQGTKEQQKAFLTSLNRDRNSGPVAAWIKDNGIGYVVLDNS